VASPGDGGEETVAGELGPLPGGHHGLTREQIVDSQRERLLAAMVQQVTAKGYRATTITDVVKSASVSTRDFYELFSGKEDCVLAAFEVVHEHLQELVSKAVSSVDSWPNQIVTTLRVALDFFGAEPDLARLCLVESVAATPRIAIRFRESVLACEQPLARGRAELVDPGSLLPGTEDAILGGIVSLLTRSLISGQAEELPTLLPDLAEFALGPYLGAEPAAEIAKELRDR
jgi:AcrR family transcriptional regulator